MIFTLIYKAKKEIEMAKTAKAEIGMASSHGKRAQVGHTLTTPKFEEQDNGNSRQYPLAGKGIFIGTLTAKGSAPTIQVSINATQNCIIYIQQSSITSKSIDGCYNNFAADDKYEYTTPNKPMFIQRTLGFNYYRVICESTSEEVMKHLYLTTQLINHPAITQGIITAIATEVVEAVVGGSRAEPEVEAPKKRAAPKKKVVSKGEEGNDVVSEVAVAEPPLSSIANEFTDLMKKIDLMKKLTADL